MGAMTHCRAVSGLGVALALLSAAPDAANAQRRAAPSRTEWQLVWRDEFSGTAIDTTRWGFDLGNDLVSDDGKSVVPGWGNNELECYTSSPENAFVTNGLLHLRARTSSEPGCRYTSARMTTRRRDNSARFAQRYGRFEFRASLPVGRGLWPALWLLPLENVYGTWAASGEIDVMEARGQTPSTVLGTLHYGAQWPGNTHTGADYVLPHGGSIADFHTYALEWEPGRIRWLVDGVVSQTQTFWWSRRTPQSSATDSTRAGNVEPWPAPFDRSFYLLMNLAVGGNFLGNPDATTAFPAEMLVDYVRVYARPGRASRVLPRGAGTVPPAQR
jgi:beta-glucanase (GH16 family)